MPASRKKYRHLFGPVPSRRLGRSLGVDLVPPKTCCQNCVFCQLGRTTQTTVERKEYVETEAVLTELEHWLANNGQADYITLAGSGEPTLHSHFGRILAFLNAATDIPSVLLTNGTLLHLPNVRKSALRADVVKISLSAWDQPSFEWVNRPDPTVTFKQVVQGYDAFRKMFKGQLWMEVFVINGMNADPTQIKRIAALARRIAPDRIHLNTAVRPPAEDFVTPLSRDRLAALTCLFEPPAEIIAEFKAPHQAPFQADADMILAMLQRRPCTARQIADVYDMRVTEVLKYHEILIQAHKISAEIKNATLYYTART